MRKAFLFVALVLNANTIRADAIQTFNYTVSGDVGTTAGVPLGSFGFEGAPIFGNGYLYYGGGQSTAPGSFLLGQFDARALPANSWLTYTDLPFYLTMYVAPAGQPAYQGGTIQIVGLLNGTVGGSGYSSVVASIQSITAYGQLPFPLADFKIDVPQVLSATGTTNLTARIGELPPAVPEPSTLATIVAGLVLAARRLRRSEA